MFARLAKLMPSASADSLSLLADDIEDPASPGVTDMAASTWSSVSATTADAVRRRIPQATASSIRLAAVTFRTSACLGVRVRVADGHVERGAAQQVSHVARIVEVPDDVGQVAQGRAALFFVLQPGKRGGGLAAVFLVHPDRDAPAWPSRRS